MKKSLLLLLVLVLALTPALVACNTTDPNNSGPVEPTVPVGDENHMYVWWNGGASDLTVINTAIVEFLEANPQYEGKTIEAYTPASQDRNALEISIAGRTAPSMVRMDHVYISALGANGNVENLLDPKYNFGQYEDRFIPSTWEGVKYKDKVFGLPFDANTITQMYNIDLLNEAGVGVPTTYDELLDVGRAVKALPRDNVYGTTLSFNDRDNWTTFSWLFWLWRMGGEVLNEDYTEATFNQQPGIDALNKYVEIIKTQQIAPPGGWGEGEFNAGNIATYEMGQWAIPAAADNPNFKFAPMINLKEGVPNYSGLGLYALSIVSESAGNVNTQMAYDFALHLATTPKYSIDFCKPNNFTPSLIEASQDDYFNDEIHKVFVDQLQLAKARPGVACWPQIEESIHMAINEVMNDGRSVTEALNSAATRVNQLLKSENENYQAAATDAE